MAKVRVFLSFEFDKDKPLHRNFYEQAKEHSCYAIRDYSIMGRYAEEQGATEVVLPPPLETYDDTGRSESTPDESAGDRAVVGTGQAGRADAVPIQDAGDSEVDAGDAGTGTDSGESESADATVAADERDGAGEGDGAVPAPSGPGASGTVSGTGTPGPGGGSATPDTGTQPAVAGLSPTAQAALDAANRVLNKTATPTASPKPTAPTPATPKTPAVAALTPAELADAEAQADALLDEFFPDDDILSDIIDNAE